MAAACSLPVLSSPIPATSAEYVLLQDFMQLRANFAATALNTAHPSAGLTPDFSAFVLVEEGERRDVGNGLVRWTRKYALAPEAWDYSESYAYTFIGFQGLIANYSGFGGGTFNPVVATGRIPQSWVVSSRVHNEYFLVGAGQTYASSAAIPVVKRQQYLSPVSGALAPCPVDYIWDAITGGTDVAATTPDRTTYEGWMTAGTEIVSEDSRLTRWLGNIWLRQTRYVVAQ